MSHFYPVTRIEAEEIEAMEPAARGLHGWPTLWWPDGDGHRFWPEPSEPVVFLYLENGDPAGFLV